LGCTGREPAADSGGGGAGVVCLAVAAAVAGRGSCDGGRVPGISATTFLNATCWGCDADAGDGRQRWYYYLPFLVCGGIRGFYRCRGRDGGVAPAARARGLGRGRALAWWWLIAGGVSLCGAVQAGDVSVAVFPAMALLVAAQWRWRCGARRRKGAACAEGGCSWRAVWPGRGVAVARSLPSGLQGGVRWWVWAGSWRAA
jgi:hypothetical protein